jgi:hypothetical protein
MGIMDPIVGERTTDVAVAAYGNGIRRRELRPKGQSVSAEK